VSQNVNALFLTFKPS